MVGQLFGKVGLACEHREIKTISIEMYYIIFTKIIDISLRIIIISKLSLSLVQTLLWPSILDNICSCSMVPIPGERHGPWPVHRELLTIPSSVLHARHRCGHPVGGRSQGGAQSQSLGLHADVFWVALAWYFGVPARIQCNDGYHKCWQHQRRQELPSSLH